MTVPRIGFSIKFIETKGPNTFKPLLSQSQRKIHNVQAAIIPQIPSIQQQKNPAFPKNSLINANAKNGIVPQGNLSSKFIENPSILESNNNNSAILNEDADSEILVTETMENSPEEVIVTAPFETSESTSQPFPNENNNNKAVSDYETYSRPYRDAIEYLKNRDTIAVPTQPSNNALPLSASAPIENIKDDAPSNDETFWSRHRVKILTSSALFITAAIVWYKKDAIVESSQKFLGFWFRGANSALMPQTPCVANVPNPNPIPQAPFVTNVVNSQPSNIPSENTVKTFQSLIKIYKQRFPWTLENLKNSFKQYGKQLFIDLVDGKDIHPSEKSKAYGAYMYMLGADMLKKAVENGLLQIANGSYVRGPKWDCCLDDLIKKA